MYGTISLLILFPNFQTYHSKPIKYPFNPFNFLPHTSLALALALALSTKKWCNQ